jgi:hypothetical protein
MKERMPFNSQRVLHKLVTEEEHAANVRKGSDSLYFRRLVYVLSKSENPTFVS